MPSVAVRRLSKLSARVKRGAALLDAEIPGWVSRVDLDRLDLSSASGCPLGQLYGGYHVGSRSLGLSRAAITLHGFHVSLPDCLLGRRTDTLHALTLLWAAEIILRRRKADARRLVAPPKAEVAPVLV